MHLEAMKGRLSQQVFKFILLLTLSYFSSGYQCYGFPHKDERQQRTE